VDPRCPPQKLIYYAILLSHRGPWPFDLLVRQGEETTCLVVGQPGMDDLAPDPTGPSTRPPLAAVSKGWWGAKVSSINRNCARHHPDLRLDHSEPIRPGSPEPTQRWLGLRGQAHRVRPSGFEPETCGLRVRGGGVCGVRLSLWTASITFCYPASSSLSTQYGPHSGSDIGWRWPGPRLGMSAATANRIKAVLLGIPRVPSNVSEFHEDNVHTDVELGASDTFTSTKRCWKVGGWDFDQYEIGSRIAFTVARRFERARAVGAR
jgi:hypothetical protein